MKVKVTRKSTDKPKHPFMGILSSGEIKRGAAGFKAEVNSKEIRLKATKVSRYK